LSHHPGFGAVVRRVGATYPVHRGCKGRRCSKFLDLRRICSVSTRPSGGGSCAEHEKPSIFRHRWQIDPLMYETGDKAKRLPLVGMTNDKLCTRSLVIGERSHFTSRRAFQYFIEPRRLWTPSTTAGKRRDPMRVPKRHPLWRPCVARYPHAGVRPYGRRAGPHPWLDFQGVRRPQ
jgi:hypothetical protein